jgi:serine protease Do
MNRPSRRALAVLLCAAFVGGMIPPEAVRAAAIETVNLNAAGVSAGVSAAGVSAFSAQSVAPLAPALTPSVSISAPSSFLSAPTPTAAPSAEAIRSFQAPQAAPALSAPSAVPAASQNDGRRPSAPQAAAPRSRMGRLAARVSSLWRRSAPESGPAAESRDAVQAGRLFDGAAARADAVSATAVKPGVYARAKSGLSRWAGRRLAAYQKNRDLHSDSFGGPKVDKPMTFLGKIGYGVKWGLNLTGIAALMQVTVAPLLDKLAWPLLMSPTALGGLGRVELLTHYGPAQIVQALAASPLAFLGLSVPMSTAMEEFTYRFLGFGLTFGALALVRPLTELAAKLLDQIPDASGVRSTAQRALRAGGRVISYYAFPLAAGKSAFSFAVAHFALWGVNPYVFAINMIAGWILARAAYKSRGLTAPFIAHLVFNAAMLGGTFLAVSMGLPLAALVYTALTGVVGVASLWYTWRLSVKERAARAALAGQPVPSAGWKTIAKRTLVAGLIGATLFGGYRAADDAGLMQTIPAASYAQTVPAAKGPAQAQAPQAAAPAQSVKSVAGAQDAAKAAPAAPAAAAAQAAQDTAAVKESDADMVARVKPSVVKVTVTMQGGYAIGSGVIISPTGVIVTNAHVVDAHQPGEIVKVELANGQNVPAKILAVNHDRDMAILQLPRLKDGAAWPFSKFAATAPREGDAVFAMGHPLGLPFTVTKGIVSGLGSRGNMYVQYLQTDASITHGNSGGPLYNAKGEVLGINTMGPENAGSIGFSIIAPAIQRALAQYAAVGNINTAALGIITDLSSPDQPDGGVAVEFVRPGSAADKAGIRRGDVIVGIGRYELRAPGGMMATRELSAMLAQAVPGQTVQIGVVRGDKLHVVKITLDAKATSEATSGAHSLGGPTAP